MFFKNEKKYEKLLVILFLAFFARLFTIFLLGRHLTPELWEYSEIASNLINGKGYYIKWLNTDYYSLTCPLYSSFLAIQLFLTRNNYFIIELINIILSVATCYLIYVVAKRIFGENVALIASFLAATHPGLIVYVAKIHEFNLVVFFMVLVYSLILFLDLTRYSHNLLIGFLIGLGVLLRPTFMFFFPAYLCYLYFSSKLVKKYLTHILLVSLAIIVVITPWMIRNYHIHKRWIFTTSSAEHFWRGNNPLASGGSLLPDKRSILEIAPKEFLAKLYSLNELGQYDLFYKEAFKFIKSNPAFFIKMLFKKFSYFWWFSPQTGLLYPKPWAIIYKIYYSSIFMLFMLGLYFVLIRLTNRNKAPVISLLALFILISLLHSLYYVEMRHRWAIEPLMVIFSCYGFIMLFENLKRHDPKMLFKKALGKIGANV